MIKSILEMLGRWESRLCGIGVHDNLRCTGLWLQMFPDGSGNVMANYAGALPDDSPEKRTLRAIFEEPESVLAFNSLDELHGALVSQTMTTREGD